jgi:hypothetical protein
MEKNEISCFAERRKNCFMNYISLSLVLSITTCKRTIRSGTKVSGVVQAASLFPERKNPINKSIGDQENKLGNVYSASTNDKTDMEKLIGPFFNNFAETSQHFLPMLR